MYMYIYFYFGADECRPIADIGIYRNIAMYVKAKRCVKKYEPYSRGYGAIDL